MSGLTGIWNLDHAPVSRDILAAMSARMAHRGPDGEKLLLRGNIGFAHQSLRVTPESMRELQPLESPSGQVLLWDGRLDNREEILSRLNDHTLPSDAPDPNLVLAAYMAFQDEFVRVLEGDFALAIFDPSRQQLLLARDIMGGRTLYYCQVGDHFLFATEVKALLRHPEVPMAVDEEVLAQWLYRIPDYSDRTRTFYKGVKELPAGHVLRMTANKERLERFWSFDLQKELRLRDHREYVDAYREAFSRAVRRCSRSAFPIAIGVSGGLDSSSILCMAMELKRSGETMPPLIGLGIVPEDPAANEWTYQSLLEQKYGITLERFPLTSATMASDTGQKKQAWYSEGPHLKWELWRNLGRYASTRGARVMLSGYFGDHLLLNQHYLLDLMARGRFIMAYGHLQQYFDWWEGMPRKQARLSLYRDLKGYLVPESLRPLYHRLRRKAGFRRKDYIPWFSRSFVNLTERLKDEAIPMPLPSCRAHVKILAHYVYSRLLGMRFEMELKVDSEFPCETAFPFRDRSLVALVMAMPGEVVYRAGSRGIHREAMKGILPEAIRTRRNKAMFLEPVRQGAIDDLRSLADNIAHGSAKRLGLLKDPAFVLESLGAMQPSLLTCKDAILPWLANDIVCLEEWLSTYFRAENENQST
jgi:asparagine synthase (glutamine-hydrolysing)